MQQVIVQTSPKTTRKLIVPAALVYTANHALRTKTSFALGKDADPDISSLKQAKKLLGL
jgi:hypothetical protein